MNIIITNEQSQIIGVHKTHVPFEDWVTQEGETKQSIKDEDFEILMKSKERHLYKKEKITLDDTPIIINEEISELEQLKAEVAELKNMLEVEYLGYKIPVEEIITK